MQDLGIYLFGGVVLAFMAITFYVMQKFRARALRQRRMRRTDLRQTRRQLVKYTLWTWLAIALLSSAPYLTGAEQDLDALLFGLLICLIAPLFFVISLLWSQVSVLRHISGLPIVDDNDDEQAS